MIHRTMEEKKELVGKYRALVASGLKGKAAAKELGVQYTSIWNWIKRGVGDGADSIPTVDLSIGKTAKGPKRQSRKAVFIIADISYAQEIMRQL